MAALFAISAGGICCSGSGDDPGEQEKPVDPPPSPDDGVDWSKIDPKATVRGVVTCAGAAVQGVVVTDGVNMTRTNKQGAYGLRTSSDKSKLVYLTVPSGYEVESTRGFIPRFYRRVTAPTSVEQVQRHDFTLKKVNNDRHIMIVSADMHIRNRAMIKTTSSATPSICPPKGELDSTTFRRTYLKTLRDYVKALPAGVPVYGMNLGDMTQESHWTNANKATLANFVNVCERGGMPIQTFHAIGNHDHDMAVQNIAGDDDSAAELAYISALGPTYYAVNIGKVHYVVFDNTQYVNTGGDRSFAVRLNRRQMDWAQKDADYMPSDVERIVIAWHCPAFRRNPGASSPNPMDNADELLDIYKDKQLPVTIWSGHNHIAETVTVPRSDMSVTEYTHPCVCGAWWYFPLCHDGAPATFTRYDFSGGTITERRAEKRRRQAGRAPQRLGLASDVEIRMPRKRSRGSRLAAEGGPGVRRLLRHGPRRLRQRHLLVQLPRQIPHRPHARIHARNAVRRDPDNRHRRIRPPALHRHHQGGELTGRNPACNEASRSECSGTLFNHRATPTSSHRYRR